MCSICKLTSDKGKAFIADIIREITALLGVNHSFTIEYSKEENGMVERENKEILRHLRNIIFERVALKWWSDVLPMVQRILNASVHGSTGVAPAELVYGKAINLDAGFILDRKNLSSRESRDLSQWVADRLVAQDKVRAYAQQNLRIRDQHHIESNMPEGISSYPVGALVLVEYRHNSLRKGPPSKLLPYLKGPMKVVAIDGGIYTVQSLLTKGTTKHRISKLRPFCYDPRVEDPVQIALRDDTEGAEFVMEKITNMRGDVKGSRFDLYFEVFWTNYSVPTWESWKTVRGSEALLRYLRSHSNYLVRALYYPREERSAPGQLSLSTVGTLSSFITLQQYKHFNITFQYFNTWNILYLIKSSFLIRNLL